MRLTDVILIQCESCDRRYRSRTPDPARAMARAHGRGWLNVRWQWYCPQCLAENPVLEQLVFLAVLQIDKAKAKRVS